MEEDFAWAEGLGEEWPRKQRQVDILQERVQTSRVRLPAQASLSSLLPFSNFQQYFVPNLGLSN